MYQLVVARSVPDFAPPIPQLCVPHFCNLQQAVRVHLSRYLSRLCRHLFCDSAILSVESRDCASTSGGDGHLRACIFTHDALVLALLTLLIVIDDFSVNLAVPGVHPTPWHLFGATSRPRVREPACVMARRTPYNGSAHPTMCAISVLWPVLLL